MSSYSTLNDQRKWLASLNPISVIFTTSLVAYSIFKRFQPTHPAAHFALLGLLPLGLGTSIQPLANNILIHYTATSISYYVLVLLFVCVYRLSPFHPLARYPGPVLNRLTKLRMVIVQASGKQHIYYQELFTKYGDVVRTGPNELMFVNVNAVQPILGSNGLPKGPFWDHRDKDPEFGQVIGLRDPVEAAKRRKLWQRGFTPASLDGYNELIVHHIRQLCEAIDKQLKYDVDLSKWSSYFSFDFMGDLLFGQPFRLIEEGCDSNGYWDLINGGVQVNSVAHAPWLLRYFLSSPMASAGMRRLERFALDHVDKRISNGSRHRDLYYHLSDEEGLEKRKPPRGQLYSDAVLAIVAGSDSTATVLTALWYYLLLNRDCLERLQGEIDAFYPDRVEPTDLSKQEAMPYLNACINEALRLVSPVISGGQRHVGRETGGKAIGPWFVPEQTSVFVHTYSIHRDPRYFSPSPESFWPDRWLPAPDRKYRCDAPFAHDTQAFIPFSFGPARCVGKKLAMVEMRAVVCFLLQRYTLEPTADFDPEKWPRTLEDYFVVKKGELRAIVRERK